MTPDEIFKEWWKDDTAKDLFDWLKEHHYDTWLKIAEHVLEELLRAREEKVFFDIDMEYLEKDIATLSKFLQEEKSKQQGKIRVRYEALTLEEAVHLLKTIGGYFNASGMVVLNNKEERNYDQTEE